MRKELPIPPAADRDHNSVEMIRIWIAENRPNCVLNIGFWEDRLDERKAWGMMLADVVRHIANAHAEAYGRDANESLERILDAFGEEIASPTSNHPGSFS